MMTRKHFKRIAEIIKKFHEVDLKGRWQDTQFLIDEFAHFLEDENPRFNQNKFRQAILEDLEK